MKQFSKRLPMKTLIICSFILLVSSCSDKSEKIAEIDALIEARSRYKLNAYKRYHNYFFGLTKQATFNERFPVSGVHATYDSVQKKLNSMSVEYYPDTKSGTSQYEIIDFDDSNNIIRIQVFNEELPQQRQAYYYFANGKLFHSEKNGIEIADLDSYLHGIDSIHTIVKTTLVNEGLIQAK